MNIGVSVNGEARLVPDGTTLGELVPLVTKLGRGVAAAVNGEVVPHSSWGGRALADGDLVEIVTAVPGG
jgi:sulfur carrier protein